MSKQGFAPQEALIVGTIGHTSPAQFGKVMSMTKPRMAVGYHFQNDFDTLPIQMEEVRKTYDGPVSFAQDYMVWNITKDSMKVRMSAIDEDIFPEPAIRPKNPPPPGNLPFSEFTLSGAEAFPEVMKMIWGGFNQKHGTTFQPPAMGPPPSPEVD